MVWNKTLSQNRIVLKLSVCSKWEAGNWLSLCISSSQTRGCDNSTKDIHFLTEDKNLHPKKGLWDRNGDMGPERGCQLGSGRFRFKDLPKWKFKSHTKSEAIALVQSPACKGRGRRKGDSFALSVMIPPLWKLQLKLQMQYTALHYLPSLRYSASIHSPYDKTYNSLQLFF